MGSSKRADSDLTSVSSGLSTIPDETVITNGKGSKSSKPKSSKPAKETKAKTKTSTVATKGKKTAANSKGTAGKESGKSSKYTSKSKSDTKGKTAVRLEIEKVEKRQRTYGLLPQDVIEYAEDEDIKSDWQVPYVWAFIAKFCKEAVKGLCIVDDFEAGLQSMGPHDGIAEALAALLKGVQGQNPDARPKQEPSPDQLAISVKKLLESRLKSGCPLTVFDSYVYEVKSYVPKDQAEASASARKEPEQYDDLEETDVLEDRRRRNPLTDKGFWAVEWQVRLKILRQLVDWTLSTKGPVREALDSVYTSKKARPASTIYSCDIEGVKDGRKRHLYRIDPSYRVYAANKMYHMGAPLNVLTSTRAEYENLIAEYKASQKTLDQLQKNGKRNAVGRRNAENDVKVGELLAGDLPKIEEAEAEIVRAKERYQKAQARKLRALAQLETSSFALTTRSRTRKVVNYNEAQAEDEFDEELPSEEYDAKRQQRSSTSSSFQEASLRGAKRDFDETESLESASVPPVSSRNDTRAAKRARGDDSDSRVDSAGYEDHSPN